MSKSYVIQWRSTVNGRTGRGTKVFDREGAQELAKELNEEYPEILHEAVEARQRGQEVSGMPEPEPALTSEPTTSDDSAEPVEESEGASETSPMTHDPDHALSFQ